ncbi:NYN domain-containing protein [Acidihalobacter ferrooxydans]|uniref:NYN domain-containing protein n=1 Tax=Acidihalobacter ferrooxydans TaxID=1765967 RepID=A0A1P8UK21_9GAMM|nr:NYN domain-containing protein [Acidihalobacter ferrooxydans]APZ44186.1 NYN domain-containing protein [Acidihalobacter ferrooxydans]
MDSTLRVGVYVDVSNIHLNGGYRMQFDALRDFACRDGAHPARLNAYLAHDANKATEDPVYRNGQRQFHAALRDIGYKVIVKNVRWYTNEDGERYGKANMDLELAVDALLQCDRLDRIVIASGDGDFAYLLRALQNRGCRAEVIAFNNVSADLRREADLYMSGYLVPGLLPIKSEHEWGDYNARMRGVCYHYDHDKGFGFVRFLRHISPDLHVTDTRDPNSPYATAFFHASQLPPNFDSRVLPSREHIFEFTLRPPATEDKKDPMAVELALINV